MQTKVKLLGIGEKQWRENGKFFVPPHPVVLLVERPLSP